MSVAMEDWPRRHRISVDEYHRMAESGSFAPDARVELIDGEIIDMPPIGITHAGAVDQLYTLLHRALGERAIVRCQSSVQLGDCSEPQPDFVVLAPRKTFYKDRRPTADDTLLVIEVSDSTLEKDLRRKMMLYARHGIREYWVVDLVSLRLHVFRNPTDAGYAQALSIETPGTMEITALRGASVDLSTLFCDV
jgi:Uma2 family endonuclease